ncbi:TNF receptor-associated factor 4 [Ixodes scapularis]|uniref:TNF receptor-associated factor 4 n=1 Tax=Ixodes scapularis TaxID=6945 RepID=UPI001A9E45A4|nr:TNF receptor-associated factor 4 [Ixodes scapularis]
MKSFRVAGFSDALDWRPTLFQEPIIAQKTCAVCGVLYRKSVRLPCIHTLCTKCHAQCVDEGSVCPVDKKPFCEDDVEKLEVPLKYVLNRTVACWNAPKGCSFIGPVAHIQDHYKECGFNDVPCCLCHSTVLQTDILEHFRNGCSIPQATCLPTDKSDTQDLRDVSKVCLEMNRAVGKISEDIMLLQSSLNRCSEDATAEGTRCKGQLKVEASRLTEQLNSLSTVCATECTEGLQGLREAVADYKKYVRDELCVQRDKLTDILDLVRKSLPSPSKHERIHWYIERWTDLKNEALRSGSKSLDSPKRTMYGYNVSQSVQLTCMGREVGLGCFMHLLPGEHDSQLEWPFSKVLTVGVIHPKGQSNVISYKVNSGWHKYRRNLFLRPKGRRRGGFGAGCLSTAEELEFDGFIENDTLHVFLEIEP